jgi:hypothetical protein
VEDDRVALNAAWKMEDPRGRGPTNRALGSFCGPPTSCQVEPANRSHDLASVILIARSVKREVRTLEYGLSAVLSAVVISSPPSAPSATTWQGSRRSWPRRWLASNYMPQPAEHTLRRGGRPGRSVRGLYAAARWFTAASAISVSSLSAFFSCSRFASKSSMASSRPNCLAQAMSVP